MSVTAPSGFVASAVACGIKDSGDLDLALVATGDAELVPAAGVFTDNLAAAAPVTVSRRHLESSGGRAAGVVFSSGNANAATGARGISDAQTICELAARPIGVPATGILLCQTGLIGIYLPMKRIEDRIGDLVSTRSPGPKAGAIAAQAIMTTDTIPKEVAIGRSGYVVGGMAKGAAMLAPNMATMLAILTTDAVCEPGALREALSHAVEATFNQMTIDGCTSTNDSVVVLANGRSGLTPSQGELADAFEEASAELSAMMTADAEGATKVVRILVKGCVTESDARRAARRVAESQLVKCSLNGGDPYWGRIVSELGTSGTPFVIDKVEISYGGVVVCRGGVAADHDAGSVVSHMKQKRVEIVCDLGLGAAEAEILTCDLGHGYIDENRTTS